MSFSIETIREAQKRIEPYVVKTPLIRAVNLDGILGCEVYLKPECLQLTGSFKIRGAFNKILSLSEAEIKRGFVAASSGNHGKGVAYAAKLLGTKATIVIPDTAPEIKIEAIKALGADVVLSSVEKRFETAKRIADEKGAVVIPPFDDYEIMSGQGTLGVEIMEDCPELDYVVVPVSGGGLISGVATAVKAMSDGRTKVIGAEPAALPRYSKSLEAGKPTKVESKRTVADALPATMPGEKCFPVVQKNTDCFVRVGDEYILKGMKLLLLQGHLLAEASSAIGIGAMLEGLVDVKLTDKVCFVISGGSAGMQLLHLLDEIEY